jgi:hypothetical protein
VFEAHNNQMKTSEHVEAQMTNAENDHKTLT